MLSMQLPERNGFRVLQTTDPALYQQYEASPRQAEAESVFLRFSRSISAVRERGCQHV